MPRPAPAAPTAAKPALSKNEQTRRQAWISEAEETIAALEDDAFDEVEAFLNAEARRHGVSFPRPVDVSLGEPVAEQPPAPPRGR